MLSGVSHRASGATDSVARRRAASDAGRPRQVRPGGALARGSLPAAAAVGAGPDEAVAFAFLVVEEVGVDWSGEARIVQLEAEIIAALVGALGPGGADLGVMRCTA